MASRADKVEKKPVRTVAKKGVGNTKKKSNRKVKRKNIKNTAKLRLA